MSGSLAGAVITTFLAPACRCLDDVSLVTEDPGGLHDDVHAHLAPRQRRRILRRADPDLAPVDEDRLALGLTSASRAPWTESCLSRCASVLASARSLTATTSMSGAWSAARKNTRPMRPNPLTPTRTAHGRSFGDVCRGLSTTSATRRTLIIGGAGSSPQASGRRPEGPATDPAPDPEARLEAAGQTARATVRTPTAAAPARGGSGRTRRPSRRW